VLGTRRILQLCSKPGVSFLPAVVPTFPATHDFGKERHTFCFAAQQRSATAMIHLVNPQIEKYRNFDDRD
jgi:hypothetical protein